MALDLKDEKSRDQIVTLASVADVIVENFRPGVLERSGLGYNSLSKANERLVYCSISGYGQSGSYTKKGAFDVTVQGMSGLMSVTGESGREPVKCGVPVGDFCAGLYAAYSVLAKVMQARETGIGGHGRLRPATITSSSLQEMTSFGAKWQMRLENLNLRRIHDLKPSF